MSVRPDDAHATPTVDVVVPVCNEGPALSAALVRLADYFALHSRYRFDFLIVDDGSLDETRNVALSFARHRHNVTVLSHDRRYGLGRTLRTAFNRASADYTIVVDPRLRHAPYVAMQLLEALDADGSDIALVSPPAFNLPPWLSRPRCYYEVFTCMIRAYKTRILKRLQFVCDGLEANAELLLDAIHIGARIFQVPVHPVGSHTAGKVREACKALPVLTRQIWSCRLLLRMPFHLTRG